MSAIDPFADLEQSAAALAAESTTASSKKETAVSESTTQSKIVTTLKGGAGYNAPWVVIHSDTPQEALDILKDEATKELLDQAKKVGKYFGGKSNTTSAGAPATNGKPAGASQAPNGVTPPEGYVYKSGMSERGPWQAFMPIDRNSGLEPIWLNADGTRRN